MIFLPGFAVIKSKDTVCMFNSRMSDKYRPVPLSRHVYGYPANQKSDFKFDLSLNYKLSDIISKHSKNRPTLIVS